MTHASFEKAIIDGLDRLDDASRTRFEECACDLLRDDFPSLAPLPGGADCGVDGVISDGATPPFGLCATTGTDVIGNLTKSLISHLKHGGRYQKVIVATSQRLTPRRVRDLDARATEHGFQLVQTYQHQAWVHRLYHSPKWCRKLLDIDGNPPALSLDPGGSRPHRDIPLVGQDEALAWLTHSAAQARASVPGTHGCAFAPEDRILVGPPGSGKTFLLQQLVSMGVARFCVANDYSRIIEDLRTLRPAIVIVDDAHVHVERLRLLRDLRHSEPAFEFSLVATTWGGEDRQVIMEELQATEARVRELPRLPRQALVEIIAAVGIREPVELVKQIVDQAANRPGLAVTLAHHCLIGGWREVVHGQKLAQTLLLQLTARDQHVKNILGVISLGGRAGIAVGTAAGFLGLSTSEVRNSLVRLDAAGIVVPVETLDGNERGDAASSRRQQLISVKPRALRLALAQAVFFSGSSADLDYRTLLKDVASVAAALDTIVGVAHLAQMPAPRSAARSPRGPVTKDDEAWRNEIQSLLTQHGTVETFAAYAALGQEHALWALDHCTDVIAIARGALVGAPAATVRRLLELAIGEEREPESYLQHPLRVLEDWLSDLRALEMDPGGWYERRRVVLAVVESWIREDRERQVAGRVLCLCMSPKLESTASDPGLGARVTISQGAVPVGAEERLRGLWSRVRDGLFAIGAAGWPAIERMLRHWAHPEWLALGGVSSRQRSRFRRFAGQMVRDLAGHFGVHAGFANRLSLHARNLRVKVDVRLEPLFELLSPTGREIWGPGSLAWKKHRGKVRRGAGAFLGDAPESFVRRIHAISSAAEDAQLSLDSWLKPFCEAVWDQTSHPLREYLVAFVERGGPPPVVFALLERCARRGEPSALDIARRCLDTRVLVAAGVNAILRHPTAPLDAVAEALKRAEEHLWVVKGACSDRQVPFPALRSALAHPSPLVALAAVEGEWSGGGGHVRQEVESLWREAVVRCPIVDEGGGSVRSVSHYSLREILTGEPALGLEWLRRNLEQAAEEWTFDSDPYGLLAAVAEVLSTEQRIALVGRMPAERSWSGASRLVIDGDVEAYRYLLGLPELAPLWLGPLRGGPASNGWAARAALALKAGVPPSDAAHEALFGGRIVIYAGSGAEHWRRQLKKFEGAVEELPELAPVLDAAHQILDPMIAAGDEEDRRRELVGLHGVP